MNCRRCGTENPETSRYCSTCGAFLSASAAKRKSVIPWYSFAGAGFLALLVAAYFLLPGLRPAPGRAALSAAAAAVEAASDSAAAAGGSDTDTSALPLVAGRFAVVSPSSPASPSIEAVFFDGAWTALPLWAFLGANGPLLESPGPSGAVPSWVDWTTPSPVVLCRFELGDPLNTPELAPFDETKFLEWRPLSGERTTLAIETGPLRAAGPFKTFALFEDIEAPGVLLQGGWIVGWT